jgi:hypothetical protein
MNERAKDAVAIFGWMFLWSLFMWSVSGASTKFAIVEKCDNNGGFVYEDVRYTCERVGP